MSPLESSEVGEPRDCGAGHAAGGNVPQDLHDVRCGGGGGDLCGAAVNVGLDGADGRAGLDDREVEGDEEELLQGAEDEGGLGRAAAVPDEVE